VQGVTTHERGHTSGLGHLSEQSYPNQTMSERINGFCQGSERSLGRGDSVGLNRKYPWRFPVAADHGGTVYPPWSAPLFPLAIIP
jgi:hypothetical protein